jgi:hypothetical protein
VYTPPRPRAPPPFLPLSPPLFETDYAFFSHLSTGMKKPVGKTETETEMKGHNALSSSSDRTNSGEAIDIPCYLSEAGSTGLYDVFQGFLFSFPLLSPSPFSDLDGWNMGYHIHDTRFFFICFHLGCIGSY